MTLAANQEVQIEWEQKDYHSPTSLFKGMGDSEWGKRDWVLGIRYQERILSSRGTTKGGDVAV